MPDNSREKVRAFEDLLTSMTPAQGLLAIVKAMLSSAWDQRLDQTASAKQGCKRETAKLDKQQDALLERLVETSNPKTIAAFETKIVKLEDEKMILAEKPDQNAKLRATMGEIFKLLSAFLSNPWKIYEKDSLAVRKTILKTVFRAPLAHDRNEDFRTP